MFKGLKSKIAEETKRIQDAVVNQVGEGLNSLTSKRNENFDTQKVNRTGSSSSLPSSAQQGSSDLLDISFGEIENQRTPSRQSSTVSDSFFSAASSSSLMQEAEGELTPTRQRHDSVSSIGSVDSFFPSIPNSGRLAPIPSDIETDVESVAGSSSFISGASKEQISSVLTKLQGRAANYKDKYRLLIVSYRELSKENEKIRNVLTTSQDKALRRIQELKEERTVNEKAKREMEESLRSKLLSQDGMISTLRHQVQLLKDGKPVDEDVLQEIAVNHPPTAIYAEKEKVKKLEELLTRCKDSIKSYKEKIQTLGAENQELKKKLNDVQHEHQGNSEISDFAASRTIDELKSKLKLSEETWQEKLNGVMEANALNLAQVKQEMHSEIESKDQTIEELRKLIKSTEKKTLEMDENFKVELEKAKETERLLEQDKKELLQELSRSKQAAVQLLKEDEEKKRDELHKNYEQNLIEKTAHFEKKLKEAREDYEKKVVEKEKEFAGKMKEYEEQMNLAIEERDLQKMAALSQHDERIDRLQAEVELLKTEKLQLESELTNTKQEGKRNLAEMLQKSETRLKANYDSELLAAQQNFDRQLNDLNERLAENKANLDQVFEEKASLERQIDELRKEFAASRDEFQQVFNENEQLRKNLSEKTDELSRISTELTNSADDRRQLSENLKNLHITLRDRDDQLTQVKSELAQLQRRHDETMIEFEANTKRCEFMEKELQRVLDDKRAVETDFKQRLDQLVQTQSVETADVQKQLEDLKNMEIAQLKSELERIKQEFAQRESVLKQELQQRGDELMFSREELTAKDGTINTLRLNITEQASEVDRLKRSNEEYLEKLRLAASKQSEYETELEKLKDLSKNYDAIVMQLDNTRVHVKNLEQEKLFALEEKNMQIRESNEVLGALEEAIDVYRKQLANQTKESESTKQHLLKDVKYQITERESRLNDLKDRVSDLEDAVEVYKSQYSEKSVQMQQKNEEISNLREKLSNLIRDSFFYSSEKDLRINELSDQLVELDVAVEAYKKQNELLKKEQEEMGRLRLELSDKTSEIDRLKQLNQDMSEKFKSYSEQQNELETLRDKMENALGEIENLKQENAFVSEQKNEQVKRTEDVLAALKEAVDLYSSRLANREKEFDSVRQKLMRDNRYSINENESLMNDLKERISDLEDAVEVYKSRLVEDNATLGMKNQEMTNLREKLSGVIENSFFYNAEKDIRLVELLDRTSELEEAVEVYRKQNESLKNENDSLKNELNKQSDDAKNEEESTKMLENLVNDLKLELETKKGEIESLNQSLERNLNENNAFVKALWGRTKEFFEKSDLSIEFNDELDDRRKFIKNLDIILTKFIENKSKLDGLHTKLVECGEKMKSVENEFSTISTKLAEKESAVIQLNSDVTSANDRVSKMQLELDDKINEIRSLNQEILLLNEQLNKSDQSLQQKIRDNDESLSVHKQFEHQCTELKEKLNVNEKELETLKSQLTSANNQIDSLVNQLSSAKDAFEFEKERMNQECDVRVADYKKKAETKLSQIKKLLESDKETLNQRVIDLEAEIRAKMVEIQQLKAEALSNSDLNRNKISDELESVEERHREELKDCRNEYESKIAKMTEDHNDRVKQMAKEFQAEISGKETQWQDELSAAYNRKDEDRERVTKEYQKGMKQLYQDLQDKNQKIEQMKMEFDEEKAREIQSLNEEHEKVLQEKDDQFKTALKQRLEEVEKQHKKELEGLMQEWNVDRRVSEEVALSDAVAKLESLSHVSMTTAGNSSSTENNLVLKTVVSRENLEQQAQVAQGDAQVESPLYLKQRVKQLESQLESLKEKLKRETADLSVKNSNLVHSDGHRANNAYTARNDNERLSSISLDYSNPVFCEPTEAEYLRNIVFRYMVERESLGRESVTLAKAIAAVLKLSLDQTKEVLAKEESRLSSWFP